MSDQLSFVQIYLNFVYRRALSFSCLQQKKNQFIVYQTYLRLGMSQKVVFWPKSCALYSSGTLLRKRKLFCYISEMVKDQGWEFAHQFCERSTLFCPKWANERFPQKNEWFAHFWWATWAIRSRLLIFGERPEGIAHGRSVLVSDMSD